MTDFTEKQNKRKKAAFEKATQHSKKELDALNKEVDDIVAAYKRIKDSGDKN